MKRKFNICLVLLHLIGVFSVPAQERWTLENEYLVDIENFYMDNLGYFYLLRNNEIVKMNQDGDTLFQFSNKLLGDITDVDVQNTLRPIVFFRDNAQLIITDNTLTIQNKEVDLTKINLYQASLIASSRVDNGIWIYDRDLFQLIKISTSFERYYESGNLEQILGKEDLNPIQLLEANSKVYLLSPLNGILVFDVYGSYINTIPILHIEEFQMIGDFLFYKKNGKYYYYNLIDFVEEKAQLPIDNPTKILIAKNKMAIWKNNQLFLYRVESEKHK